MPRFKDQAICIRHIDWSETSQVVVLLTREHGKLRGVAKGSKRMSPSSVQRFSGGIELLTEGQVVATTRPTAELANITEWDLQQPHHHFRVDLAAQQIGLYAADVCNQMLETLDAHPRCFEALAALLPKLADPSERQPALLQFQWVLLDDCGYRPVLDADVHTGEQLPGEGALTFDGLAGGLTRRPAAAGGQVGTVEGAGPWRVRAATIELLRHLANADDISQVSLDDYADADLLRANRLLCVYLRTILDRELPTMQFVLR